jgi:hypothetical protein
LLVAGQKPVEGCDTRLIKESNMRHLYGIGTAVGLVLGTMHAAQAQDSLNAMATTPYYPSGYNAVSPYGVNGIGYGAPYAGSWSLSAYSRPFVPGSSYYSSSYVVPRAGMYSYVPGTPYPSWPGYTTRYPSYYGNSYVAGSSYYGYSPRLFGGGLLRRSW